MISPPVHDNASARSAETIITLRKPIAELRA